MDLFYSVNLNLHVLLAFKNLMYKEHIPVKKILFRKILTRGYTETQQDDFINKLAAIKAHPRSSFGIDIIHKIIGNG